MCICEFVQVLYPSLFSSPLSPPLSPLYGVVLCSLTFFFFCPFHFNFFVFLFFRPFPFFSLCLPPSLLPLPPDPLFSLHLITLNIQQHSLFLPPLSLYLTQLLFFHKHIHNGHRQGLGRNGQLHAAGLGKATWTPTMSQLIYNNKTLYGFSNILRHPGHL